MSVKAPTISRDGAPAGAPPGGSFRPGVYLQPIAPPAAYGLFGFFASTMVLSSWILGWWGTPGPTDPGYFFLFNAAFGGIVQFTAGLWSFKARDYVGSSLLTMWGTYWMAWGILQALGAAGTITLAPLGTPQPGFAIWFIPLGLATFLGSIAALSRKRGNVPLFALLFTIGVGSLVLAVGLWAGSMTWIDAAAGLFVAGAICAWYVAAMALLLSGWNRVILPTGKFSKEANIPGRQIEFPTEYTLGQPGVRQGQA